MKVEIFSKKGSRLRAPRFHSKKWLQGKERAPMSGKGSKGERGPCRKTRPSGKNFTVRKEFQGKQRAPAKRPKGGKGHCRRTLDRSCQHWSNRWLTPSSLRRIHRRKRTLHRYPCQHIQRDGFRAHSFQVPQKKNGAKVKKRLQCQERDPMSGKGSKGGRGPCRRTRPCWSWRSGTCGPDTCAAHQIK